MSKAGTILEGLTASAIDHIRSSSREVTVEGGGLFYRQGDRATDLYILHTGKVRLSHLSTGGAEILLRFVYPAEIFGLSSLLPLQNYSETAHSAEDSVAIALKHDLLNSLVLEEPRFSANLLQQVVRRHEESRQRYVSRVTLRVEARIAQALLSLAQHHGQERTAAAIVVPGMLIQKELAELAGTTIYTVSRVLSGWEHIGIVTKSRGRVIVSDRGKLEEIAAGGE